MKKPYLRHYKDVNGFRVFIVDGSYIRKKMNSQFTNFGQHYRFPDMIPMREFWLDKQYSKPLEYDVFIAHMEKEWDAMRDGKPYGSATSSADAEERKLRTLGEADTYKLRNLGILPDGVVVWLVNGKKIRDDGYVDFTEGGHDIVYDWIPESEIWIDNAISAKERPFVLAHESHERDLMCKGTKYKNAHNSASVEERNMRNAHNQLHFINKDGVLFISNKPDRKMPTFITDSIGKRVKLPYFNKPKNIKAIFVQKG